MNDDIMQELLDEVISSFEAQETQSRALLGLLKEKELAGEEEISRQMEQAAKASNVRWRAVRVRMERLLLSWADQVNEDAKRTSAKSGEDGNLTARTTSAEAARHEESTEPVVSADSEKDERQTEDAVSKKSA